MSLSKALVKTLATFYVPTECVNQGCPQQNMRQKLGLTDKNKHNVIYWCNFIREVCEQYSAAHPQQLGCFHDDGRLIVVEIDESKYFHRKYHREQWREGH